jgi:hypothetical protein
MRFLGGTVKAEGDGTNRRSILHQQRVDSIKMPSVSYKSKPDPGIDYCLYDLVEPGMDCHFTPGKRNIGDAHDLFCFTNNLFQKFRRKELRTSVVKRVFISDTITAMEIADISQLNRQPWEIIFH